MEISTAFFLLGSIIVIGFLGNLFFQRTKIPDVLMLMIIGMLIGPIFNIVNPSSFNGITQYFAALALIILLFDGGLGLNIFKVIREISKATGFTAIVFTLTIAITGIIMSTLFSWNIYEGILLGAVVGGTSSAIVIGVLNNIKTKDSVKTLLTLESSITDVLCIIVAISVIEIIHSNSLNLSDIGNQLTGSFSIAAVIAVVFGLLWMEFLKKYGNLEYGYLMTLAMTFILYSVVESIQANGSVAALVFGLMLANATDIAKMLRFKGDYIVKRSIFSFHKELSFFIRTFFFVYVGILIDINSIMNLKFILMSLTVITGLVMARYIGTWLSGMLSKEVKDNSMLITSMMPRGLAAAVLASLPSSVGLDISGFVEIAFLTIIATNTITTIGVYMTTKEEEENKKDQPKKNSTNVKTEPKKDKKSETKEPKETEESKKQTKEKS